MAMSQAEKTRSHARIVTGAARLTRERGIEATSVADVMSEADMTHGGFYKHFPNKDALIGAAVTAAFNDMLAGLEARYNEADPAEALAGHQQHYLSQGHIDTPGAGCPIAALSNDVSRGSGQLKAIFAEGMRRTLNAFAKGLTGSDEERREAAARKLATLVGAVVIARASDSDTARLITKAVENC